jgi:hypothetical protein
MPCRIGSSGKGEKVCLAYPASLLAMVEWRPRRDCEIRVSRPQATIAQWLAQFPQESGQGTKSLMATKKYKRNTKDEATDERELVGLLLFEVWGRDILAFTLPLPRGSTAQLRLE